MRVLKFFVQLVVSAIILAMLTIVGCGGCLTLLMVGEPHPQPGESWTNPDNDP